MSAKKLSHKPGSVRIGVRLDPIVERWYREQAELMTEDGFPQTMSSLMREVLYEHCGFVVWDSWRAGIVKDLAREGLK